MAKAPKVPKGKKGRKKNSIKKGPMGLIFLCKRSFNLLILTMSFLWKILPNRISPQTFLKLGAVNQDSSFVIQLSQWVFIGIRME